MLVLSVCIMEEVNNFLQVKLMKKENIQVNQKENYGQKEAVTWWFSQKWMSLILSKLSILMLSCKAIPENWLYSMH